MAGEGTTGSSSGSTTTVRSGSPICTGSSYSQRTQTVSIRRAVADTFSIDFLKLIPTLNIQTGFRNQLEIRSVTENYF
jgi:hypothetical protein